MSVDVLYSYFMNLPQFALTWGIFFGAGLVSFAIQLRRNRHVFSLREVFEHCVPFDPWRSKSFHMDVIIYIYRKFTDFIFAAPGFAIAGLLSIGVNTSLTALFGHLTPIPTTFAVAFLCTIVMFLAAEFADYVVHYLEHKVPALWELHKVHHSADFLNPLTSKRGHSLPILYGGAMAGVITGAVAGVLIYLFDISLPEALLLKAVASKIFTIWTLDPLKHSHIPVGLGWFDRVLISPHMHQVHHSKLQPHWDKNFGTNLSIYDWIFGTGYRPAKGEEVEFGIAGYSDATLQKFNTLRGAFINPIIRSWKAIQKRFRQKPTSISSPAIEGIDWTRQMVDPRED
ncbi:sterol desaturase family protein [Rhizobium sp. S152]|uniref:sterol desaturase family protein n=1 Tax=Rhizobium sp. S152 TaxID=3055038 RepID=UPI0025A96C94|nr:sterol desaturase family protein [Rhizobium sp. S152]MDM9625161.1 sterol desaturase family protein [Rhizobium sp. S152]